MRIVFAGTPDFAVPPLQGLLKSEHSVVAVLTQPDRPQGRGRKILPGPVKRVAIDAGIPVYQPVSLREPESLHLLQSLAPDLMVVVAYGLILPKYVIDIPDKGCINIHASLLPRWRGAAPIQRAILEGDSVTGVTLMFIEPKLDAGPMILAQSTPISASETSGELHDRLALIGQEALMRAINRIQSGDGEAVAQDDSKATYAEKIQKNEARLDFNLAAQTLDRKIRAFNPWPVAETMFQGQAMRIWRADALDTEPQYAPGTLYRQNDDLLAATGLGCLRIRELQLPGGKRISDRDFLNTSPALPEQLGPT